MILIALGANLPSRYGNPEETFSAVLAELPRRGVEVLKVSRIIVTRPVPASDQPDYRNGVVSVATKLAVRDLHALLKTIEREFGREEGLEWNAARVLDLDLLAYNRTVIAEKGLQVPHARMHQRDFVLGPLCEIAQEWEHPVLKQTASQLFHSLPEKVSRETEAA
ncbi:MAG: 2-amino-4-hydroxy-6-hydroxymethyldihydropteridine diphosphokinase [Alphaproteobacteria bacterium]